MKSGKISALPLLRGILIETEMIIAWGSFISHERLNLKKLNIHFERKVMWGFESPSSSLQMCSSVSCYSLHVVSQHASLLLSGMILTWAGRMGWLQEAHLGAKTLSWKATTTKITDWKNVLSSPLLFEVEISCSSTQTHTHTHTHIHTHTHTSCTFSRSDQVKTGKKKWQQQQQE